MLEKSHLKEERKNIHFCGHLITIFAVYLGSLQRVSAMCAKIFYEKTVKKIQDWRKKNIIFDRKMCVFLECFFVFAHL